MKSNLSLILGQRASLSNKRFISRLYDLKRTAETLTSPVATKHWTGQSNVFIGPVYTRDKLSDAEFISGQDLSI